MQSTKTIGWILVIGVILSLAGLLNPAATADWSNDAAVISALAGNVDLVAITFIISAVGQIIYIMGYSGIRENMTDGLWKTKVQIGVMLALTSAVINVAWSGLMVGTGEAASLGQAGMGIAAALYASANSVSLAGNAISFIGFALIGIGMMMGKAINNIIALVIGVLGIFGLVLVMVDNNSTLLFIPFMGIFIMSLIIGIMKLRQS
mgnify:CR=1 FL=1|tara:strand:- start:203 stop:820 length:618 start_codon:yes stop_codon:yes gene_type:complete